MLFDDRDYVLIDELARRAPNELLLVAKLRIEFEKIHARKRCHKKAATAPFLRLPESA
jgi:hypothetical protein